MHPATLQAEALTSAGTDGVWAELQKPETWAAIGGVERSHDPEFDDGGNLVSYRFEAMIAGKGYPGTARTTVTDRPRRMVVAVDSKDLSGNIEVRLTAAAGGTRIEVATSLSPKGFLATLMFGAITGAVAKGLPGRAEALARRCEGLPD